MPFYEYQCPQCKEGFTLMRPMADRDEPAVCPECGGYSTVREVSAFSAVAGGGDTSGGGGCGSGGFT